MTKLIVIACAAALAIVSVAGAQDGVPAPIEDAPDEAVSDEAVSAVDPHRTAWIAPMQRLAPLVGAWSGQTLVPTSDGWEAGEVFDVSASFITDGAALFERTHFPVDGELKDLDLLIGYDQFREIYRVFAIDAGYGIPDIYQGVINEAGDLVVDNLTADTSWVEDDGTTYHFRLTWTMSAEPHAFLVEYTVDQGVTWGAFSRMELTPLE